MLKKSLLERMQESKDKHGVACISVFNSGKVRVDENYMMPMIKYANDLDAFKTIGDVLYDINESYSREYDFDTLSMNLELGLVFDGKYADEDHKLSDDAEPMDGIVRYYTMEADCYLDDEKTNTRDAGYYKSRQGFIGYNRLVSSAEKNGLTFNGPRTFEEFKEQILIGEPFDISLTASFKQKDKSQEQVIKTK